MTGKGKTHAERDAERGTFASMWDGYCSNVTRRIPGNNSDTEFNARADFFAGAKALCVLLRESKARGKNIADVLAAAELQIDLVLQTDRRT